jgi:hypothetical protein
MLSLLSKFAPGEIRFALVATLAKLELDINSLTAIGGHDRQYFN